MLCDVKLWALSDLHVRYAETRAALERLDDHGQDWVILAGDIGETEEHLEWTLECFQRRFAKVLWVPGNHELWGVSSRGPGKLDGPVKYDAMVSLCRARGVVTPEDPYLVWPGAGAPTTIALCFVGYDYSFRPADVPLDQALDWAAETGVRCTDESMIKPAPFANMIEWCQARVRHTEARLAAIPETHRTVLVNHFPLRHDLVWIPRVPRFSIWCGTTLTETWHTRFRASVVVSGHLHVRSGQLRDGVRFEEVSLGYPQQYDVEKGPRAYLRLILPELAAHGPA